VAKNKKKTVIKKPTKQKSGAKKVLPKKKLIAKKAAAKKPAAKKVIAKKSIKKTKPVAMTMTKSVKWSEIMTPLDDRLIVTLIAEEKMTAGGLYIPDTVESASAHRQGKVVSVGRGHRDKKGRVRPLDVQAGDQILFTSYSGDKVEFHGQTAYILRESEVVGILS
jgi:chaperonin GroES